MKDRPKTSKTLAENLRALMREFKWSKQALAQKSGISDRMIGYVLAEERNATIEVADSLAKPFGLTGWQLLIPGLPVELARSGKLEKLVANYSGSSNSGREYIDLVAEKEAKYEDKK